MLLSTMTYKEMYDHLSKDLNKIQIKKDCLFSKAIKEFKKAKRFPIYKWYEYTIPATQNKYIVFFYSESRKLIDKPYVGHFAVVFDRNKRFVIQLVAGGYKHTEDSPLILIRQVHVYSSHFFERYNERILKNKSLSANDIACIFLSRNQERMPIKMNSNINKHIEGYGESAKFGYRVRDGFCFAREAVQGTVSEDGDRHKDKIDAMMVMYTTFMNESDMDKSQISAINKEHIRIWLQHIQDIHKQAKDGVVTLTLEK